MADFPSAPTLEELEREFSSSGHHDDGGNDDDDGNNDEQPKEAETEEQDDDDSLVEVLNASGASIPSSSANSADSQCQESKDPPDDKDRGDELSRIPSESSHSRQLRFLQAKNQMQSLEIGRLERHLRILTEMQGISMADFQSQVDREWWAEAHAELRRRVASLQAQLGSSTMAPPSTHQDAGASARKIAILELRIGQLEELEEKQSTEIEDLYRRLMEEKTRNVHSMRDETEIGSLQSENQLLREKNTLLEQQLSAAAETFRLRNAQFNARFRSQEENLRDLDLQLSQLQKDSTQPTHVTSTNAVEAAAAPQRKRLSPGEENNATLLSSLSPDFRTVFSTFGGKFREIRISSSFLGAMCFKPHELNETLFSKTSKALVTGLQQRPVVVFVAESSAARSNGVKLGHVLLKVNGIEVSSPKEACRLIKAGPRPLPLLFYVPNVEVTISEGQYMVNYDTRTKSAPRFPTSWKPKYVVIGGVRVNARVQQMEMYRSKVKSTACGRLPRMSQKDLISAFSFLPPIDRIRRCRDRKSSWSTSLCQGETVFAARRSPVIGNSGERKIPEHEIPMVLHCHHSRYRLPHQDHVTDSLATRSSARGVLSLHYFPERGHVDKRTEAV